MSISTATSRSSRLAPASSKDGQNERAVRLLAARHAISSIPGRKDLKGDNIYEECLIYLRSRLGKDAFTTTWAEGAAMTPEQALEEALAEG